MYFKNLPYIPAFWYMSDNFGDSLTHYLIKKISGKTPVFVNMDNECDKVVVTGSILNNEIRNAIVWGTGLAFSTDHVTPKKEICAVRGKLTGELLQKLGVPFNPVYGDPCMLMPILYRKPVNPVKYKLGIFPHFVDTKLVYDRLRMTDQELAAHGIKIINVLDDVEEIVRVVCSCEKVIASSLHALILCDSYGIPASWAKFSNDVIGDDFKFKDYYSLTNNTHEAIDLRNDFNLFPIVKNIADNIQIENTIQYFDPEALFLSCPFRIN